ncbi:SemiSWEET family transporter [Capnocytophaga cynodegmi]|uniref:SemiSWEET family transporter n=1 Tax=Capnocytophaga cynodegmi TaxID=28189 RepID=UPI0038583349
MIDLIGYVASFFVVLSFLIKDNILYIRFTNLVGCILFVIYGFLIDSIPIILPNAFLVFVQVFYILKKRKQEQGAKNSSN